MWSIECMGGSGILCEKMPENPGNEGYSGIVS